MEIRKVHVVFKTHLDIGFTDFSANVIHHYTHKYIPAAMAAAKEQNREGAPKRFIWTVGSFMVDYALRTLSGAPRAALDDAIRRGDITYHGLPHTTHSELCTPALFRAGLNITKRLDKAYGRKTVAAKMSDVPGHTLGIIAPMAEAGIEFLHIGINAVAAMPRVPSLFMWENEKGQQIMVNYTRSYGGLTTVEGHDEALYFLHSDDNMGPPSGAFLAKAFGEIESKFPSAEVVASTLDAFAVSLRPLRASLPVIRDEIGDTWVHGIGVDPYKTSMLRTLTRLCEKWDQQGLWAGYGPMADGRLPREAFMEELLLVCEHTWGLDTKKYLTDFVNWSRPDFEKARKGDYLQDSYGMGTEYEDSFLFARREFEHLKPEHLEWPMRSYSLFEKSHQEQRDYITAAIACLPAPLIEEAKAALAPLTAPLPSLPIGESAPKETAIGGYRVVSEADALVLYTPRGTKLRMEFPLYQEVGTASYDHFVSHYLENMKENREWAIPDNDKPGLKHSDAPKEDVLHRPKLQGARLTAEGLLLEGYYEKEPQCKAGCPQGFRLLLASSEEGLLATLHLFGKPANRKPEALFLPFVAEDSKGLRLLKIGDWIDPTRMVPRGNHRVHGIHALRFAMAHTWLEVQNLDTPLVALGAPRMIDFEGVEGYDHGYMSLLNNLWGTNFKMWYEEDILARFLIREIDMEERP